MPKRSAAKISLRNEIFNLFFESYTNKRELISLEMMFYAFRSLPAIIDKNRVQSFRILRHASYEACRQMQGCGVLILIEYSTEHHHTITGYKVFDSEAHGDQELLKIMQRKRVNRVQATSHITMDQLELAVGMGMSLEEYRGSCIIEKAKVIEIPAYAKDVYG